MERGMKETFVGLLAGCLIICGCGSKKTTSGGGSEVTSEASAVTQQLAGETAGPWSYDSAPTPAFDGTPDYRLTSFGFPEKGTDLKPEAVGACREAVKKLADKPEVKLLVVGFADGIKESQGDVNLGMRRADATRRLLKTLGIPPGHVQVASFGSHYATAKDFERIKMGLERKVEIWVLK
jgi:outer membrane protein OmpA-like peptidoglycan-associated protein